VKWNVQVNPHSKPNPLAIGLALFMMLCILNCVGMELEREGLWMWGMLFDFICWYPNKADVFTVVCIIALTSPIWVTLLFVRWCLK
jgi:hypothetical protein